MVSYGPHAPASSAALASQPGHSMAETPPAAGRARCCRAPRVARRADLLPRNARSGDAALLSPRISGSLAAGAGAADRRAVSVPAALALAVLLACQPARAAWSAEPPAYPVAG